MLEDSIRKQTIPLKLSTVNKQHLDLALVSFKQYSQQRSEAFLKAQPKEEIPKEYEDLLENYKDCQTINFKKRPLHGVIHSIETGSANPCRATVRPLVHGSEKAKQVEKTWREMEELGIVKKV